ncbi:MAG TPA: hypothetical protein VFD05_02420 [Bacilli bacterium]|nr:hypothetical protein [Bacilli bacterium]
MIIDLRDVRDGEVTLTETLTIKTFPKEAHYSLKAIEKFTLAATLVPEHDSVGVYLKAEVPVMLECAYTLKHFKSTVTLDEYICFTTTANDEEEELDDCYYEKGPHVDLTAYVFILLLSAIPLKVVAPGAKLPDDVLTEEEHSKSGTNRPFAGDPKLDALYDELDD